MCKDIVENKQESIVSDREETIEKREENKEWKYMINLPHDLDFEVHQLIFVDCNSSYNFWMSMENRTIP